MSIHSWLDRFSMGMAGKFIRKKYFSEEADSPSIREWLENLSLDTFPEITGTGKYPVVFYKAGEPLEAAFFVEQWRGDGFPTIIYHHGAAEGSYDFSFNRILKKNKDAIPANLIAIQALFNHSNQEFMDSIARLSNYTFMLAASAQLVEELTQQLHQRGCPRVIVTGVSLGGIVTNIHFTYFHSADRYMPMLAGAKIGEVYISSAYAKVASDYGKSKPENLRRALNFEADMRQRDPKKVFPLMAEYDQLIELNVQKGAYEADRIHLIPFGHATGALKSGLLREHILKGLTD